LSDKKVPLIASAPISEFGDFDPADLNDGFISGQGRDGSYVPGFSELRVARDTAIGKFNRGEIARGDIPSLPVNLRWARSQDKAGKPDSSKPFSHGRRGFRYVTKDMVGKEWLKEQPGGTSWDAEGHLRNGDTVLMVCDAKSAARNQQIQRMETDARLTGVTNTFEQNLKDAGVKTYKGADVTVEKVPTPTEAKK
jgi:hypothetical protein